MNRSETNPGPGRGSRRPLPRRAAVPAAMALIAMLATACGGGSPSAASTGSASAASATGGSTRDQTALAYAQCMRAHGVASFPDPDSNGDFNIVTTGEGSSGGSSGGGRPGSSSSPQAVVIDTSSPQVIAADHACHHLLNAGTQLSQSQQQQALSHLVQYSQCMRSHGVPNFPDPQTTNGGVGQSSGVSFEMTGIDTHSPQYQAAQQACQSLAQNAKGGR